MSFLDKSDPLHQRLFDGFVFVLFERVGKQLFFCTFGHHRSAQIVTDITLAATSLDFTRKHHQAIDAATTRLEVGALVIILERAMGLAPKHMNPSPTTKTSKHKDILWILDDGKRTGIDEIPEGAAKVVAIDIKTKKIIQSLVIPKPVLRSTAHYNDLRVDLSHGKNGTVYIANSGFGKDFSLNQFEIFSSNLLRNDL